MAVGTVEAEEGPAYGAALLAGVGAGVWPSIEKACQAVIRPSEIIQPNPKHVELLNRCYRNYQQLYPALRDAMHRAG
jgi:xylulokinase